MTGGEWFDGARLGMFVHWDHASQQGLEVSWPLVGGIPLLPRCQSVPVAQYHSSAATFDPGAFDARDLAARAAAAGVRYAVLTTKHHSGYCLWPTATTDWSIAASPGGRDGGDLVGEFVDAMRAEGIRIGLYFSLPDWHHPDYPAFSEEMKPYVLGQTPPLPPEDQWSRFVEVMFAQVRELLTGYGDIDVLWFDGGWERSAKQWRSRDLMAMVRELQPQILVNERLPGAGDFTTPEQFVPATPPGGRWETCMTMNHSWGWNPDDTEYKSGRELVHTLAETAAKGGNLLLNVSPRGDGSLPPAQVDRLDAVAGWMQRHAEAIHDTTPGLDAWQFHGPSTRRGDRIHLICVQRPYDDVPVRGIPVGRVRAATVIGTGTALTWTTRLGALASMSSDPVGEVRIAVPEVAVDEHATVIALDIAAP